MELERFDNYWRGAPLLDKVRDEAPLMQPVEARQAVALAAAALNSARTALPVNLISP